MSPSSPLDNCASSRKGLGVSRCRGVVSRILHHQNLGQNATKTRAEYTVQPPFLDPCSFGRCRSFPGEVLPISYVAYELFLRFYDIIGHGILESHEFCVSWPALIHSLGTETWQRGVVGFLSAFLEFWRENNKEFGKFG